MPLLRKKEFQKTSVPELLRDDEEVFHCAVTNEIFRDYDEFCQRIILVNSMVWSCAMTGKTNLTYVEALQSERAAKKSLKDFPMELRIPVLFLATKTKRTGFSDMAEDVFSFIKDRFFVGEIVESSFTENNWKESHVLQVIGPNEDQIEANQKTNSKSPEKYNFSPSASLFRYEVEQLDANDQDSSQVMIVEATHIRRKKGPFSKERNRLFLKQYVEINDQGYFVIKDSVKRKFKLNSVKFDQIFDGPIPNFEESKRVAKAINSKVSVVNGKKVRQETLSKYLDKSNSPLTNGKASLMEEMRRKEKEYKQKVEEMKQKKIEEKEREKQKKKEESLKLSSYLKDWYKPRDDLELEDQKVLPTPTPVQTKIPDKYFGDTLMILEFVSQFSTLLHSKDFFPGGLTLDLLERALFEKEVAGPLADIIQMLLSALFNVQEEEVAENRKSETEVNTDDTTASMTLSEATRLATLALNWSKVYQGMSLSKLPLYPLTISEVLRLHLLSSGARLSEQATKWRYQQRGGYMSEDDPGLSLRIKHPHILKALSLHNVNQLPIGDKLIVLTCLIDQLLTYADVRDTIEERIEKTKTLKSELRSLQASEKKLEQEFISGRMKIKKENKGNQEQIVKEMEKLETDLNKKKFDIEYKTKEIMNTISEHNSTLGTDRAYQRYYKLSSIPGLFVENDEKNPGSCLDKIVTQKPELVGAQKSDTLNYVKKLYEESYGSNKENENGMKKVAKKINGSRNSIKIDVDVNSTRELLMCTANPQCPIHLKDKEPSWGFYHEKEEVDKLISSLNKRGVRESDLRLSLEIDKEHIETIVTNTNASRLNPVIDKVAEEIKPKKVQNKNRYEESNLGYPMDMEVSEILSLSLIDSILEMEDKISNGHLGQLKVKDREKWRTNLENKRFNELDKTLIKKENPLDKIKKEEKENNSRPGTPDSYKDPGKCLSTVELNGHSDLDSDELSLSEQQLAVKTLAIALAQVSQAVELKYVKRPLGHAAERRAKDNKKHIEDIIDKWQQSLLCATSISQIFLHYCTLDNCIMWGRSSLKARCCVCHRLSHPESMLLCDSCNKGFHLYCLKPKLAVVPEGDWFCDICKPKDIERPVREASKRRRIFTEESEEEEEEDDVEENGVEEEEDEEETEQKPTDITLFEVCEVCGSGGHVICCDFCPKVYHLECTQPVLRRVPRGEWKCHKCRSTKDKNSNRDKDKDSVDFSGSDSSSSDTMTTLATLARGSGRRCASRARNKIHGFARTLRRTSVDSVSSEETPQRRSTRRTIEKLVEDDDMPLHNVPLQELLADVMKHKDAWPFVRPVTKHEVPDYYEIITKPMDFGTVKYKLNMGEYKCDADVMADCVLVFENCDTYNNSEAIVYKCGVRLLKYFENRAKEFGMKFPSGVMGDIQSDEDGPTQPKKSRYA